MAPTPPEKRHPGPSSATPGNPSSYNNNIVEISEDDPDDQKYPADNDVVHFWPHACPESCGKNLLQITTTKAAGLPTNVKGYLVDFNGCAYDKADVKKNLRSELKWCLVDSVTYRVKLSMHDPIRPDKCKFPYVLCTYKYNGIVTPCAVYSEQSLNEHIFSMSFEIRNMDYGSTRLFTIGDLYPPPAYGQTVDECVRSPNYIGRSPDGDAIRVHSERQPSLLNPMTLMLMSDEGPQRQDDVVISKQNMKRKWYRR